MREIICVYPPTVNQEVPMSAHSFTRDDGIDAICPVVPPFFSPQGRIISANERGDVLTNEGVISGRAYVSRCMACGFEESLVHWGQRNALVSARR